jgi:hypothetical protein
VGRGLIYKQKTPLTESKTKKILHQSQNIHIIKTPDKQSNKMSNSLANTKKMKEIVRQADLNRKKSYDANAVPKIKNE